MPKKTRHTARVPQLTFILKKGPYEIRDLIGALLYIINNLDFVSVHHYSYQFPPEE